MPLYEYRCPSSASAMRSQERTSRLYTPCPCGHPGPMKRVFGFALKPMMHEHYNPTTGTVVSDMRGFRDDLKAQSEAAELQTGIPHNFAPVEWGDKETLGVTGEGIDESNSARSKRGDAILPEFD